jgi:ribokinase
VSVVVVGAVNVDRVIAAERLPGPGETVLGGRLSRYGGGKGANAAVAAAAAGQPVLLVAAVGEDADGRRELDDLVGRGVDVGQVQVLPARSTGTALIVTDPRGENQIAVAPGANAGLSPAWVRAALVGSLTPADVVLVSAEVPLDAVEAAVRTAAEMGAACILNPAPARPELLQLAGYRPLFTPNVSELGVLATSGAGQLAACVELAGRTAAPVILTRGAAGVLAVWPDGGSREFVAPAARVVDSVGAGDVFNGVLAAGLAGGRSLEPAVHAAVAAASVSVTRAGAR